MNALTKTLIRFWESSIGKKLIVAITGIVLVGFLLGHMGGNLLIFVSRESLNDYAEFLHGLGHGAGIWAVRAVLLGAFALHIIATVSLVRQNRAARVNQYENEGTVQASRSSRIMIVSGLTILGFVVFHILHFTVRVDSDLAGMKDPMNPDRHDVYGMVIAGFQNPVVVLFYIVAISLLCSHLSHGVASIFQTLGLRSRKTDGLINGIGWAVSGILWAGFISVPFLAGVGALKDEEAKPSAKPAAVSVESETAETNS